MPRIVVPRWGPDSEEATGIRTQARAITKAQRAELRTCVLTRAWPSLRLSLSTRRKKIARTLMPAAATIAALMLLPPGRTIDDMSR
jgi:hypothetical protein